MKEGKEGESEWFSKKKKKRGGGDVRKKDRENLTKWKKKERETGK